MSQDEIPSWLKENREKRAASKIADSIPLDFTQTLITEDMSIEQIKAVCRRVHTANEWDTLYHKHIKPAFHNGYPLWWYVEMVKTGEVERLSQTWEKFK